MHTTHFVSSRYRVHHNGDWSGAVTIQRMSPSSRDSPEIILPSELFVEVVAEMIRTARVAELEQMSPKELVFGRKR